MGRKYDYSFLKDNISGGIVSLLSVVYDIKGKENARLLSSQNLFQLKKQLMIRN